MDFKKIILISLGLIVLIWACKYINDKYLSDTFEPKGSMCPKMMEKSRVLWLSHVQKSRENLVDRLDSLHSVDYNPLLQTSKKMADFYAPHDPNIEEAINNYTQTLVDNVGPNVDVVDPFGENANLAGILASSLPNINQEKIRNMLQTHVQNVSDQVRFHVAQDHEKEHKAYENTKNHIVNLADYLVSGMKCECKA